MVLFHYVKACHFKSWGMLSDLISMTDVFFIYRYLLFYKGCFDGLISKFHIGTQVTKID